MACAKDALAEQVRNSMENQRRWPPTVTIQDFALHGLARKEEKIAQRGDGILQNGGQNQESV